MTRLFALQPMVIGAISLHAARWDAEGNPRGKHPPPSYMSSKTYSERGETGGLGGTSAKVRGAICHWICTCRHGRWTRHWTGTKTASHRVALAKPLWAKHSIALCFLTCRNRGIIVRPFLSFSWPQVPRRPTTRRRPSCRSILPSRLRQRRGPAGRPPSSARG